MSEMSDQDLLNLIAQYEQASLGSNVAAGATVSSTVGGNSQMATLEEDRFNALNAYFARPLGNEVEDRSQVVIPEVRDTIEWIMPQLMRMFAASKRMCRFDPEGPQDVEQAELESDVVNHVFMKQNNGFFVLHDYFKDALLLRNGYAKVWWSKERESTIDSYSGLTEDELPQLLTPENDKEEIQVIEKDEQTITVPNPLAMLPPMPGQPPQPPTLSIQTFDIKIRRRKSVGKVKVVCVAPEEMRVSAKATEGVSGLPYVSHNTTYTRSELIAEGHDKALVDALPTGRPDWLEMDKLARNEVVDQMSVENPGDRAMQDIEVRDVAIMVDLDGDGMAELRHVFVAGDKVLDKEEINETPFASCSPIRMPHRHTGISYYDLLMDLQIIKTQLLRQGLDNLYIANNQRTAVDWQSVNIDDMMVSRPGGIVRTKGNPNNSIMAMNQPSNIVEQVIPALGYVDSLREMRTGVGRDTLGLDADALQNVTKGGQLAGMSAASMKIELVARLLGEGVKEIFQKIHGEILRNQDQPMMLEIAGKWVHVDPSQWKKRTNMTVQVGLGSGNREEARQNLMILTGFQEKLGPFGLVGPKQAYETFKMGCDLLGYEHAEKYAMDPASPEYAQHQQEMKANPPPPAPAVMAAQIRSKSDQAVAGLKAQTDQAVAQSEQQRDMLKLQGDLAKANTQLQHDNMNAAHDRTHDALQGHADRQSDIQGINGSMAETLIKVIGQIVAAQLKQNAAADAGAMVRKDYNEVKDL